MMNRISRLAIVDHLTGLYNRRYFDHRIREIIKTARKNRASFALVMIDIDKFKDINDTYGHFAGDRALKDLARIIKQSVRSVDVCFRYGGDELSIILPDADRRSAGTIARRFGERIGRHEFDVDREQSASLSISAGIAIYPEDGANAETLIQQADRLLYEDKHKKKEAPARPFGLPVLRAKLTPPEPRKNAVERPALLAAIQANLHRRLILITADAGYGKTTLLAQIVRQGLMPCVYYELDRADRDFSVFLSYLLQGLERIGPGLGSRVRALLSRIGDVAGNEELIVGTLLNEVEEEWPKELFLILDDYHSIAAESRVHAALDYLIKHLPARIHAIISSREPPPFPSLPAWRAKQDVYEITVRDLRFSEAQIKQLLPVSVPTPPPDAEIARIRDYTEGWITGIQLVLSSAAGEAGIKRSLNGYRAAQKPLFDFFAQEVYKKEPPAVRDFMLRSSVVDVVTPEVCDRALGCQDSTRILKTLAHRHLFLAEIDPGRYRYHRLFREFLSRSMPDERFRRMLHRRAASFYRRRGLTDAAVDHYLAAGMFDRAAALIGSSADAMERQNRHSVLTDWIARLPDRTLDQRPRLLLILGRSMREKGELNRAQDLYRRAAPLLDRRGTARDRAQVRYLHGSLLWDMGDYARALAVLRAALRCSPAREREQRSEIYNTLSVVHMELGRLETAGRLLRLGERELAGASLGTAYAVMSNHAILLWRQGRQLEACQKYRILLDRFREVYRPRIGILYGNAARIELDIGNQERASEILDEGWKLCRPYDDPWSRVSLQLISGVRFLHQRDYERARKAIESGLGEASALGWLVTEFSAYRDLSRLYRYQGELGRSARNLEQARSKVENLNSLFGAYYLAEKGLLEAAERRFERAERTAGQCFRLSRRFQWKTGEFISRLIRLEVLLGKGRGRRVDSSFLRLVAVSRAEKYDGILTREMLHHPDMLRLARRIASGPGREQAGDEAATLKIHLRKIMIPGESPADGNRDAVIARVRLMGAFEIREPGAREPVTFFRRTSQAILSFFILHPRRPWTWQEITSWAWPDSPPEAAHQMFKNALYEIRRTTPSLETAIRYRTGKYELNPDHSLLVDVDSFQSALKSGEFKDEPSEIERLEKALVFYGGPLLPDLFYPWLSRFRDSLQGQYGSLLSRLAELHHRRADYAASAEYCRKYLETNELDERIHRLLIVDYARLGDIDAARRQYSRLRKALREKLNASPGPETAALIEKLSK